MTRGGKRTGSGRPKIQDITRLNITLSFEDKEKYKILGGVNWLRVKIQEDYIKIVQE